MDQEIYLSQGEGYVKMIYMSVNINVCDRDLYNNFAPGGKFF